MKIGNRVFDTPYTDVCVIPRGDGNVIFRATAIVNFGEFDRLCPRPQPPKVARSNGAIEELTTDPDYQNAFSDWYSRRNAWMAIHSLKATVGLEWATVDYNDSNTWPNWDKELENSFFSMPERNAIYALIRKVNGLDNEALEEARASFLRQQGMQ